MGVLALTAVLNHSKSTGVDRLFLLALADSADDYGDSYVSQQAVHQWTNAPMDTLINAADRLERSGEIVGDITQWHWMIRLPGLLVPPLRKAS